MVICPLSSLDLHPPNIQTRLNCVLNGDGSQESNHPNGLGLTLHTTQQLTLHTANKLLGLKLERGEGGWVVGKAQGGKGFLALLSPSQLMSALLNSSQLRV